MLPGMAHLHRFFCDTDLRPGTEVRLEDEEAHHALHAVRLRTGEVAAVINGRGGEGIGEVIETTRHSVSLRLDRVDQVPAPARRLTIAQATLHQPKATEFLVRHGTELGVSCFVFFRGDHSERAPGTLDKFERVAVEAMKQSGRRWLPALEVVEDLGEALAAASGARLIAALDGEVQPLRQALGGGDATIFVGPEGDFSPAELAAARAAGAIPISLGEYTYRSEVAATTAAALVQYEWAQLGPR